MEALRYYGPGILRLESIPSPSLSPGEVLVRVKACGVCATDAKTYVRGHPKIQPPAVLGHEVTGIIEDAPSDSSWSAGDCVAIAPYVPCGHCHYCLKARYTNCENLYETALHPGGFCEFVRLPTPLVEKGVYLLPDNVGFAEGTLLEPIACCYHGLEALGVGKDDSLLIIGDGPMGILQAEIARSLQAKPIISGMSPERLRRGKEAAESVIDVRRQDLSESIDHLTSGRGVDKVVVSVGDIRAAEQSIPVVSSGGAINFFAGLPRGSQLALDVAWLHYEQVHLLGTFGFAPAHFSWAVEAVANGRLNLDGLITRQVSMGELEGALLDVVNYKGLKTVMAIEE